MSPSRDLHAQDGATIQHAEAKGSNDNKPLEPLNERLKKKLGYTGQVFKPRNYQQELYLETLRGNVIIYLSTGSGKTFITVLFLSSPFIDEQIQLGRKVVFLAPSQDLVKQQAEYINKQVRYRIKVFCGQNAPKGVHIDDWDKPVWAREMENVDIFFMTPDIFARALDMNYLAFQDFSAIIFDEVHHASRRTAVTESNHAYARILRKYSEYYKQNPLNPKPRLIGLTASLFNNIPKDRIKGDIDYLERIMEAKCITNLGVVEKRPKFIIHAYSNSLIPKSDPLDEMFKSFIKPLKETLKKKKSFGRGQNNFLRRLELAASGYSLKPEFFPEVLTDLMGINQRCGPWMLREMCNKLSEALRQDKPNIVKGMQQIYLDFALMMDKIYTSLDYELTLDSVKSLLSYTRPKPVALLDLLKMRYEQTKDGESKLSCVIFVTTRLEVVALNKWIQTVSSSYAEYSFIKCDYAIGLAGSMVSQYSCLTKRKPQDQYQMLNCFRDGVLNTIVTTSVLEEGIDLPACSLVVRYDPPPTFRQYVQSRGRARQTKSTLVVICDQTEVALEKKRFDKFHAFETLLKKELEDRDIKTIASQAALVSPVSSEEKYILSLGKDKTIRITPATAKIMLKNYCNQLMQKNKFGEKLRYDWVELQGHSFQAIIHLPSGSRVETVVGSVELEQELAKNSATLEAIRALVQAGELSEFSVPSTIDQLLRSKNLLPVTDDFDECGFEKNNCLIYEPSLFKECHSLSENCEKRVYKLIRVSFVSSHQNTRKETKVYFEYPVYGMIIDSSTTKDFIPSALHGHYGQFKVQTTDISNDLLIESHEDHDKYLKFTHKLLENCLGIVRVSINNFKKRCRFYIVPLKHDNNIDYNFMENSFKPVVGQVKVGDVVKFKNNRQKNLMMLVKGIYAPESTSNQPSVEVMPISSQFALNIVDDISQSKCEFKTKSTFHSADLIDNFNCDASHVFQAFLLPAIIYRLYITSAALDIDNRFIVDTQDRRDTISAATIIPNLINLNDSDVLNIDESEFEKTSENNLDENLNLEEPVSDTNNNCGQEKRFFGTFDTESVSYINYQDCNENPSRSDSDQPIYEFTTSTSHVESVLDSDKVENLKKEMNVLTISLNNRIRLFDEPIRTHSSYIDETIEIQKHVVRVNHEIKSTLQLDRCAKSILPGTRSNGLIEALTQPRAGELYDLEAVENYGDTYLKYLCSLILFRTFEDEDEGILTAARSRLTNNKYFYHLAMKKNLGSLAITFNFSRETLSYILGRQSEDKKDMLKYFNKMRPKSLSDTFESIIGSYLVYQNEFEAILAIEWLGLRLFSNGHMFDEMHENAVVFSRMKPTLLGDQAELQDFYRSCKTKFSKFEEIIGYKFNHSSYLIEAFTHATSPLKCTKSYERLEFLGDPILDLLTTLTLAETILKDKPNSKINPGKISSSRSALVNNYAFAKLALMYNYDYFIQYSDREIYEELTKIRQAMDKEPNMSFLDLVEYNRIVKLLADVYESVAAAIYLDSGNSLDTVWSIYFPMMKEAIDKEAKLTTKNQTQLLHEYFPGDGRITWKTATDADRKHTLVHCRVLCYDENSEFRDFVGKGKTQKQAKLRVVHEVLKGIPSSEVRENLKKKFYRLLNEKQKHN